MDNATAFSIGQIVGAIFGLFLLYAVWEYVLFKRVFDDPVKGKAASVIAAWLTASSVYGYASANGGPFNPSGFISYGIGAVIVGIYAMRRGLKLREQASSEEAIGDTFS